MNRLGENEPRIFRSSGSAEKKLKEYEASNSEKYNASIAEILDSPSPKCDYFRCHKRISPYCMANRTEDFVPNPEQLLPIEHIRAFCLGGKRQNSRCADHPDYFKKAS